MSVMNKVRLIFCFFSFLLLKSQRTITEFDSILINQPETMLSQNISRKEIIKWNLKMLEKAEKENYDRGIIWASVNLGKQYYHLAKPDISLNYLNRAKILADKTSEDAEIYAKIYQEFSLLYYTMGLYDICLKYNSKAIYYTEKLKKTQYKLKFLNFVYRTRSNALLQAKKDSSLFYIRKAITTYETPKNYYELASYYIKENKHLDSAKIYLLKSEMMFRKSKNVDNYQLSILYYYLGVVSAKERDYFEAGRFLEKSKLYALDGKNRQLLLNLYTALAENYKKLGNFEKEKAILNDYKKIVDSGNNSYTNAVEHTINNLESDKKEEPKYLVILVVIILIFGVISSIFFVHYHRNKKQYILDKVTDKESSPYHVEQMLTDNIDELYAMAKSREPNFYSKFQALNPSFINNILAINPNMQNSELQLLAYIYLNFETKQIADILYLSPKTIQNRKHSIRKKLNIQSSEDIYIWVKSFHH